MKRLKISFWAFAAGLFAACPASAESLASYGMLPVYGVDVVDGTYDIDVRSDAPLLSNADASLSAKNGNLELTLVLDDENFPLLYMGTAEDAAKNEASASSRRETADGYAYTLPVSSLDRELDCAVFSDLDGQWYDNRILLDASSLPEDALLVELPDYAAIDAAMKLAAQAEDGSGTQRSASAADIGTAEHTEAIADNGTTVIPETAADNGTEENNTAPSEALTPAQAVRTDLADGEYSIELECIGGSGKASVSSPALMLAEGGEAYVRLQWSSPNYDYMIVGGEKYLNENEGEGNSVFTVPITVMDAPVVYIADTTAMGTPHEIEYTFTFYGETMGDKNALPQEAAKKVVLIALAIIIGGGILNHFVKRKMSVS